MPPETLRAGRRVMGMPVSSEARARTRNRKVVAALGGRVGGREGREEGNDAHRSLVRHQQSPQPSALFISRSCGHSELTAKFTHRIRPLMKEKSLWVPAPHPEFPRRF